MSMNLKPVRLDSPVKEKIVWAECCFREYGDRLLGEGEIIAGLHKLESALKDTRGSMFETGLSLLCGDCDRLEGGSCCGAGLESHYSGILLLINRLLGVELPESRRDEASCYFLGENGCLLLERHVICVNYLCRKITESIDPEKISLLREKEGLELETLFMLQERINGELRRWIPP